MKKFQISIGLFLIISFLINAQDKQLTYNQVYSRGEPRLLGPLPRLQGWLDDSHYLENKNIDGNSVLLKVEAETGEEETYINYSEVNKNLPDGFSLEQSDDVTEDRNHYCFVNDNDIYYYSLKENIFKRLTENSDEEKNPKFSPDGNKIAFTRLNNLFYVDVQSGLEKQLTFDGTDEVYNGYASWVYYEEILGRASNYAAFYWSPNSEMIAYLHFDDSPVPKFPLFRADGIHGELEWEHYPKAGDPNPIVKLGVADINTGSTTWIETDEKVDRYVAWIFWNADSKQLFYQWINRGQDSLKIFSSDPTNGNRNLVYQETQPTWVEFLEDVYVFKNGNGFLLRSDIDGWKNIYYYDKNWKLISTITSGEGTVKDISFVDEENGLIYYHASKDKSTETQFYKVDLHGDNLIQITSEAGTHNCTVSPNGNFIIDRYTNIQTPRKIFLLGSNGHSIRLLGDQKLSAMNEYKLGHAELFTIPSGDGFNLPVKWILPPDFDESKKYPVVIDIYGGPGAPTVSNSFEYWLNGYYLAQNGIIYMSIDHRGSGHFGKKGTDFMYRNFGKWEMHDYIEAVKWLRSKSFVDETKIGITGGSYGGYVTCMALTYGADYFTHGIAEYSVTDFRLYDNIYTERYMDTPDENPDGYNFASSITHADNYKGHLLITHGTMDDNVHMQNTIQLIDKLTSLNKDFELMLYPNERHGVGWPKFNHAIREQVQFWFRNFLGKELITE